LPAGAATVASRRPYNEWGKEGKFARRWYLAGDPCAGRQVRILERLRSAEMSRVGGPN